MPQQNESENPTYNLSLLAEVAELAEIEEQQNSEEQQNIYSNLGYSSSLYELGKQVQNVSKFVLKRKADKISTYNNTNNTSNKQTVKKPKHYTQTSNSNSEPYYNNSVLVTQTDSLLNYYTNNNLDFMSNLLQNFQNNKQQHSINTDNNNNKVSLQSLSEKGQYCSVGLKYFQNDFEQEVCDFIRTNLINIALNNGINIYNNRMFQPSTIFVLLPTPYYYLHNGDKTVNIAIKTDDNNDVENFKTIVYTSALKTLNDTTNVGDLHNTLIVASLEQHNFDHNKVYLFVPPMFSKDFNLLSVLSFKDITTRVYFYHKKYNYTPQTMFGCCIFELFENVIATYGYKKLNKTVIQNIKFTSSGRPEIVHYFLNHIKNFMQNLVINAKATLFTRINAKASLHNQRLKARNKRQEFRKKI